MFNEKNAEHKRLFSSTLNELYRVPLTSSTSAIRVLVA